MKVLVRVDSSLIIGSGHVIRCLNLAKKLRISGFCVVFICRENLGGYEYLISKEGFELIIIARDAAATILSSDDLRYSSWLPVSQEKDASDCQIAIKDQRFDWVIVDHYGLDYRWQNVMRSSKTKIMVIDDLADRKHSCDVLLDQNFIKNMEDRYVSLVPDACITLLGPKYLLLDRQYEKYQYVEKIRSGPISKILVFFGSIDMARQTELVLDAIPFLGSYAITWDIVIGFNNQRKALIEEICGRSQHLRYHCQVSNMSELIFEADLAIGAGGMTGWERCKLGLPSITTIVADNQVESTQNAERVGVLYNMGHYRQVTMNSYLDAIHRFLEPGEEKLKIMSKNCYKIFKDTDVFDISNLLKNYGDGAT